MEREPSIQMSASSTRTEQTAAIIERERIGHLLRSKEMTILRRFVHSASDLSLPILPVEGGGLLTTANLIWQTLYDENRIAWVLQSLKKLPKKDQHNLLKTRRNTPANRLQRAIFGVETSQVEQITDIEVQLSQVHEAVRLFQDSWEKSMTAPPLETLLTYPEAQQLLYPLSLDGEGKSHILAELIWDDGVSPGILESTYDRIRSTQSTEPLKLVEQLPADHTHTYRTHLRPAAPPSHWQFLSRVRQDAQWQPGQAFLVDQQAFFEGILTTALKHQQQYRRQEQDQLIAIEPLPE